MKMETNVRALSMGGAYVSVADDSGALFWNPAGLQRAPQQELLLGHSRIYEDQTQDTVGFLIPSWRGGERETWGIQGSFLAMDKFDLVQNGSTVGQARPWEGVLGVSYSRPWRDMAWGVTGKAAQKELAGVSGRSYVIDTGIQGAFAGNGGEWGVVLANLGPSMSMGDQKVPPPTVIRTGVSRGIKMWGANRLRFAGQVDIPSDDVPQGRLGAEGISPCKGWEVDVRAGFQTTDQGRFTVGFGLQRELLSVSYAFIPSTNLGDSHRIDLSFRFGGPLPLEIKRRTLFDNARAAWEKGQAAKASDILEEIQAFSPNYYPAVQLSKEVNRRIEESLKPETLFNLGSQAFGHKAFGQATDYFRKLVILDPNYPDAAALLKKAETELAAERDTQVRNEVKRARELERREVFRPARDNQRSERWSSALSAWRKVLSRYPNDTEAQSGVTVCRGKIRALAQQCEERGDRASALSYYHDLQKDYPEKESAQRIEKMEQDNRSEQIARSQTLYQQGVRAYDAGDLKTALPLFEEAARLNPDDKTAVHARDRVRAEMKTRPAGK